MNVKQKKNSGKTPNKLIEKGTIEISLINKDKDGKQVKRTISGNGEELAAAVRGYKVKKKDK